MIILDHLTKFHWICPLHKFISSAVQEFLQSDIFQTYGVPETIVSDNGSQFKANELNAFFTSYGINHIYTALYSPQANVSERVNRSLIAGIRTFLKNDQKEWDRNLSYISCALRNSIHQSIHCTPYHALFGFDMATHGSTYSLLRNIRLLNEPTTALCRDDQLLLLRINLQKRIKEAFKINQAQYNLRTRQQTFNVGQHVYRRNLSQSSLEKNYNAKLAPLFVKAIIRKKLGSHYYLLET